MHRRLGGDQRKGANNDGGQQTLQGSSDAYIADMEEGALFVRDTLLTNSERHVGEHYEAHENDEFQNDSHTDSTEERMRAGGRIEDKDENLVCSFIMGFFLGLLMGLMAFCFLCCSDAVGLRGKAAKSFIGGGVLGNIANLAVSIASFLVFRTKCQFAA